MGFVVGKGSLGVPDARVQQLRKYVKPRTVSQLRSFLGLSNFYSRFIPRFANHSSTLTSHTTKQSPKLVPCTTDMTESFNFIVSAICNASALTVPILSDSFCVYCDASECVEWVVCYVSAGIMNVCRLHYTPDC